MKLSNPLRHYTEFLQDVKNNKFMCKVHFQDEDLARGGNARIRSETLGNQSQLVSLDLELSEKLYTYSRRGVQDCELNGLVAITILKQIAGRLADANRMELKKAVNRLINTLSVLG